MRWRWRALSKTQKGLAAAGGAAALAVVGWLVNWGMPQLVDAINPAPEPPITSQLVIVDTSASMAHSPQQFTRARRVISRMVNNEPDYAVALRMVGGGCDSGVYREPQVPFAKNDAQAVTAKLNQVKPAGKADFVTALTRAVDDFQRFDAGKSAQQKIIWLILGTARNSCDREASSLGSGIRRALVGSTAKLSFVDFFIVRGEQKSIRDLQDQLNHLTSAENVRVHPVESARDLGPALVSASRRETPSYQG